MRTLGFDKQWVAGEGAHLIDDRGDRYLDLLCGYGVFAVGRNHPDVIAALQDVMAARFRHELPPCLQAECSQRPERRRRSVHLAGKYPKGQVDVLRQLLTELVAIGFHPADRRGPLPGNEKDLHEDDGRCGTGSSATAD